MGLTTALHLVERGYKVTVLEKADNVAMVRNLFLRGHSNMTSHRFDHRACMRACVLALL